MNVHHISSRFRGLEAISGGGGAGELDPHHASAHQHRGRERRRTRRGTEVALHHQ